MSTHAAAGSVLWNGATFATSKLLVLATTIVLARLLTPEAFGLVGIGLLVISYLDLVNDFGVNAAVIQHRGPIERVANVAFWINMTLGAAVTLAGIVAAPAIADFFDEPRATAVIRVLSLTMLVTSFGAIHEARLRKSMRFQRRVVPELGRAIAKGGTAIALAASGFGAWSLVWGQLAGEVVAVLGYWLVVPWKPRRAADRGLTRELVSFGSHIAAIGILGTVLRNADYVVVGRFLGTRALGLYTLAFRLPQLLVEGAVTIVGQVAFPAFARVQADPERLKRGLVRGLRLTAVVITPLSIGLAVTADPFIRVVYGSRWVPAIGVMQLLALYMLVQGSTRLCGEVYKAIGRAGLLTRLALLKLLVTVPLLVIAAPHGIVWVAAAQLTAASFSTTLDVAVVRHTLGIRLEDLFGAFLPSIRAGAAMGAVCVALSIAGRELAPLVVLVCVTVLGAVTYVGVLAWCDRPTVDEIAALLRRTRASDRPGSRQLDPAPPIGSA